MLVSNYDQNPFYMISHSISTVSWVVKEKKVWSVQLRKNIVFKFLRCNVFDDYNYKMNDNDVTDQYQLVCRMQRLQLNFK